MAEKRAKYLLLSGVCIVMVVVLAPLLRRYGVGMLLTPSLRRIALNEPSRAALIASHRFVVVGGPHRGGTTIFWRLLAAHQSVSGFSESGIESDFAEGAFLQTVLPTFGVGRELTFGMDRRAGVGLGRYAFAPSAHMTERHALNTKESSRMLLAQWGYHWNLSRPVLLEKTPTDMLTSRLLQALLTPAATSFIFVTRHPLAVALAHRRWACCGSMSVGSLALHWLVSHRVLAADVPRLRAARVLRFEDLVRSPTACLRRVHRWLGLPKVGGGGGGSVVARSVAPNTNRKYEETYCSRMLATAVGRRTHCSMAAALQPEVHKLRLGYDLAVGGALGFDCMRHRLKGGVGRLENRSDEAIGACASVAADPGLLAALHAHTAAVLADDDVTTLQLGGGPKRQLCGRSRDVFGLRDSSVS